MTTFYFVRHGEPDYDSIGEWKSIPFGKDLAGLTNQGIEQITNAANQLKKHSPQIIVSSPYTRTMHGASIMSKELNIPVFVEKDLHEWDSDKTHTVRDEKELLRLCQEYTSYNGVYPEGIEKNWESRELVKQRVLAVLEKYLNYERVIISGHALMMQSVTGEFRPFQYGEIVEIVYNSAYQYRTNKENITHENAMEAHQRSCPI